MTFREKLELLKRACDLMLSEFEADGHDTAIAAAESLPPQESVETFIMKRSARNRRSDKNQVITMTARGKGPKAPVKWKIPRSPTRGKSIKLRDSLLEVLDKGPLTRSKIRQLVAKKLSPKEKAEKRTNGYAVWKDRLTALMTGYTKRGYLIEDNAGRLRLNKVRLKNG